MLMVFAATALAVAHGTRAARVHAGACGPARGACMHARRPPAIGTSPCCSVTQMGLMSLTLREGAYKLACLHHVPPGPSPMPLAVLFCNGLKSDLAR